MKLVSTLPTNKLPILQIPELISNILNYSSNMKRIEQEYSIAKKRMRHEYKLEKAKLEQNLKEFKIMAKLTKKQFDNGHIERMEILQSVATISKNMSSLQDSQSIEVFKDTINILLGSYNHSISNVKTLESNQNKLIGR